MAKIFASGRCIAHECIWNSLTDWLDM